MSETTVLICKFKPAQRERSHLVKRLAELGCSRMPQAFPESENGELRSWYQIEVAPELDASPLWEFVREMFIVSDKESVLNPPPPPIPAVASPGI